MIHLQITHSIDKDLIGDFQFAKNLIYIGKTEGDLRIENDLIMNQHLFIEIYDSKVIVQPNKNLEYFLVNGKRTTGPKYLKINSEIDLGVIKFKLINFMLSKIITPREKMNEITDELIQKSHPIIEVIQIIQED